jgi:DNA-binding MarR family transcriptional regulator
MTEPTGRAAAEVEEMGDCVCFVVRKAARTLTQFYDRALRAHRLRVTQLPILVAASQHGSVPLATLAEVLGMDRTTLLRNVRPLARRRLVQVSPAEKTRRTEIRATASGRALLKRVYPDWKKAQDRALGCMRGSALAQGLAALDRGVRAAK